jgi:hypothetical protein
MHWYTEEEIQFLRDNVTGRSRAELTKLFNERFNLALTENQIAGALKNRKLVTGRDCRFRPGQAPHNKGTKGLQRGGEETQFKPGQIPWNYKPVGTERVNTDGYTEIKVADPKTWKGKHIIIWEEANGPVSKGYVVIFANGDKGNVVPENLLLVSRAQLAQMNRNHLIKNDAELTRTGMVIADVLLKIGERKRQRKKKGVST